MMETLWRKAKFCLTETWFLVLRQLWKGWSCEQLDYSLLCLFRIAEWLRLKMTLSRGHRVQTPCSKQGQLKQIVESCVQWDFVYLHPAWLLNPFRQEIVINTPQKLSAVLVYYYVAPPEGIKVTHCPGASECGASSSYLKNTSFLSSCWAGVLCSRHPWHHIGLPSNP